MDRAMRARIALVEIEALGLDDRGPRRRRTRSGDPPISTVPTVAEYVNVAAAGYGLRTQRTYNSYWRLLVEMQGTKHLDEVTVEDLMSVAEEAAARARSRRPGSDGRSSKESCVAAIRAVFSRALKAGLVTSNPGLQVDKPRRLPNRRRALNDTELDDVWSAVASTTRTPASTSCSSGSTSSRVPGESVPSTCASATSTRTARPSGCAVSSAPAWSNRRVDP